MKYVALAFVIALAACTSPGAMDVSGSGGGAEIKLIQKDGVRCMVLVGAQKAAMSCDWSTR